MAEVADPSAKATRCSFTREFKLSVIQWFHSNDKNILRTASYFKIDRKQVRQWIKNEEKIRKQKRKSKTVRGRKEMYPLFEKKLFEEFSERRAQGKIVKKWWFISRAKKLLNELHPDITNFKFSDRWFAGFCRRNKLSLRRKTHMSQKSPSHLKDSIEKFHAKLLRERKRGTYKLCDIANLDQTPLPFV
jgi:transposase-like protein